MLDSLLAPAAGNFSSADIFVLILVAAFAIRGAFRGIVREAIMVGGVVLAIILSRIIGPSIGNAIAATSKHGDVLAGPVGHVTVFAIVLIISAVVSFFTSRFIKASKLVVADKLTGLAFGILLGLVISGGILKVVNAALMFFGKPTSESSFTKISTGLTQFLLGLKT